MRVSMYTIAVAAVAAVTVAGCGSSSSGGSSGSSGSSGGKLKVGMVIPGPIHDFSFDQTGYAGLQRCKAQGADTSFVANVNTPDYVRTFQTLARAGNNLVIGDGQEFGTIAEQVAPQFPKVNFLVTADGTKPKARNVQAATINSTPDAFLAGVVAGLATKTNKLGGVGGQEFPVLAAQFKAFAAGAKYVNSKATTKVVYIGTFSDPSKGRQAAQALTSSGADVLYHIADNAGIGVINGAAAAGAKAIGWGIDEHSVAPSTVITSQINDQASQIADVCKRAMAGHFAGGTLRIDGLHNGMGGISPIYNLPASVQKKVDQVKQGILAGKIKVPSLAPGIPGNGPGA